MPIIRWFVLGLFALVLVAAATPALAKKKPVRQESGGEACYTKAEFEADQILEFHTELMVIGLKCRTAYPVEKPFGAYTDFTNLHRSLLSGAERRLMEHFQRHGGGGTHRFDALRTDLANQASRRAAMIGETIYCAAMVPLAIKTPVLSDDDVLELIADPVFPHLARRPPCSPTGAGAAKMQ